MSWNIRVLSLMVAAGCAAQPFFIAASDEGALQSLTAFGDVRGQRSDSWERDKKLDTQQGAGLATGFSGGATENATHLLQNSLRNDESAGKGSLKKGGPRRKKKGNPVGTTTVGQDAAHMVASQKYLEETSPEAALFAAYAQASPEPTEDTPLQLAGRVPSIPKDPMFCVPLSLGVSVLVAADCSPEQSGAEIGTKNEAGDEATGGELQSVQELQQLTVSGILLPVETAAAQGTTTEEADVLQDDRFEVDSAAVMANSASAESIHTNTPNSFASRTTSQSQGALPAQTSAGLLTAATSSAAFSDESEEGVTVALPGASCAYQLSAPTEHSGDEGDILPFSSAASSGADTGDQHHQPASKQRSLTTAAAVVAVVAVAAVAEHFHSSERAQSGQQEGQLTQENPLTQALTDARELGNELEQPTTVSTVSNDQETAQDGISPEQEYKATALAILELAAERKKVEEADKLAAVAQALKKQQEEDEPVAAAAVLAQASSTVHDESQPTAQSKKKQSRVSRFLSCLTFGACGQAPQDEEDASMARKVDSDRFKEQLAALQLAALQSTRFDGGNNDTTAASSRDKDDGSGEFSKSATGEISFTV